MGYIQKKSFYLWERKKTLKEQELTSAVPARATNAERKLKNKALDTVNPDRTRIPKSPTLTRKNTKFTINNF
jgi:hypothetical protein